VTFARPSTTVLTIAAAAAIYALFQFVLLGLPPIGVALFRIDYVMTSMQRGNDLGDVWFALYNARPVSQSMIMLQSALGRVLFGGEVRWVAYTVQHLAVIAYFFMVAHTLAAVFRARLHWAAVLAAWLLFLQCQGVLEGVYKLESVVGTMSMLFGGLALVALVRWDDKRTTGAAVAAIAAFAACVFAKEDFLLPPVLLLGWFALRDGVLASRARWIPMLAALGAVFVAFIVFNRLILPGRSFIESIPDPTSHYYMSSDPVVMLRTGWNYATGRGWQTMALFALWIGTTLLAFTLRMRWKEAIFLGLVVGGLMGPYVIMPNHQFALYAVKWQPWQALGGLLLLQCIATERGMRARVATATSLFLVACVTTWTLVGIARHHDLLYHQARSLQNGYAVSARLHASLERERDALNRLPVVAVIGVGPGRMPLSPWHNQGETDFWFVDDLDLQSRWVVYVGAPGDAYPLGSRGEPHRVTVRTLADLPRDAPTHAFVVARNGEGRLVDLRGKDLAAFADTFDLQPPVRWTARPDHRVSMSPEALPSCDGQRGVVRVDWDLSAGNKDAVIELYVRSGDSERKLWTRTHAVGHAETGAWASPGLQVEFVKPGTEAPMARLIVGEVRCAAEP
jgi:hypothetical protein